MNATEDGDEPVGEAPEYVIITAPPREALTSIPVLGENERQAIAEIRQLHRRVHPVFNWSSGLRLDEPCPECDGKAGVHPCGCWADEDMEYSCATCRDDKGRHTSYPCATTEALDKWDV